MKELIIENKGIRTDQYFIPPFELRKGELVVLYLYGGAHYQLVKTDLLNIFIGKNTNDNVIIKRPLSYVKYFKESNFKRFFFPTTVAKYLKINANFKSDFAQKIYENSWVNKTTKVNELHWNSKRLLALYATLSKTKDIVFELAGQGPEDAKKTYDIIKKEIKNDGSAILIDWTTDYKDDCSKFISIEWLKD